MDLLKGDRCMDLCWCVVPVDFTLAWIWWCNIFTSDDKLCKGDGVNNVIMFVPINMCLGTDPIVAWYKHNNIIYNIPFKYLFIWGENVTSSNPNKGKRHCTHAPTYIHIPVPLQCILPFYLQLQIYYSWDIPIPQRPLSTLTLITATSRELFIATLIIMVLNYTLMNICSLVPSWSNIIPMGYTNQALHHLTQISFWFNLPWTFHIHHLTPQKSWS